MRFTHISIALCLAATAMAEDIQTPASPEPAAAPSAQRAERAERSPTQLIQGVEDVIEGAKDYVAARQGQVPETVSTKELLTLDARACVELALRRNPQALVAQDEADALREKIGQAKAQWRPQISACYAVRHTEYNDKEYNSVLNLLGLGSGGGGSLGGGSGGFGLNLGGTPEAIIGQLAAQTVLSRVISDFTRGITEDLTPKETTYTGQVTVRQVLYTGGQISAAVKASEYLAQSQEWQRDATLDQLEYQAKQAYYDCLLAKALSLVAEESVTTFQRHLSDAQKMYDVGMISGFEVLRAKTELGARQSDLVAAKNAELLAKANLRRIISVPQDQPLDLVGKLDWIPVTMSVDDLVRYANQHRPELQALQRGLAAAGQNIRRVKGQYKPQVAGSIDYSNTDDGGAAVPDGWTFSVGAEWQIYAGGRRKHELAESRVQRNKLDHQIADIMHLIELDVRQAHIQVENAIARIQSEQGNVDLGREGLRLAELRFQEGVGTQAETLDADLALTSAESKLAQALRDYAVAHAALGKALGKSWVRVSSSAGAPQPEKK